MYIQYQYSNFFQAFWSVCVYIYIYYQRKHRRNLRKTLEYGDLDMITNVMIIY
jgi:hypothetical protein